MMPKRNLLSINDLSIKEINRILMKANKLLQKKILKHYLKASLGKILLTYFLKTPQEH